MTAQDAFHKADSVLLASGDTGLNIARALIDERIAALESMGQLAADWWRVNDYGTRLAREFPDTVIGREFSQEIARLKSELEKLC